MIDFERVTTTLAFTVESKPITVTANNTGGFDLTETTTQKAFDLVTASISVVLPDWMIEDINSSDTGVLTLAGEALTLAGDPLTIGV